MHKKINVSNVGQNKTHFVLSSNTSSHLLSLLRKDSKEAKTCLDTNRNGYELSLYIPSRFFVGMDNKWNQGLLDCVPDAFFIAFRSLVKSTENVSVSSLPNMFRFLPFK